MNRRTFLASAAASALLPGFARAAVIAYTPGLIKARLKAGETLLVDFFASWCPTCLRQHRVLAKLKSVNPAYQQKITFIQVDWDTYRGTELTKSMHIPRRSTLVALAPDGSEIGRVVADTTTAGIQALLDKALAAASA
jgi:thiol-disulfide isomerase/thioredoxin